MRKGLVGGVSADFMAEEGSGDTNEVCVRETDLDEHLGTLYLCCYLHLVRSAPIKP